MQYQNNDDILQLINTFKQNFINSMDADKTRHYDLNYNKENLKLTTQILNAIVTIKLQKKIGK